MSDGVQLVRAPPIFMQVKRKKKKYNEVTRPSAVDGNKVGINRASSRTERDKEK